MRLVVDQAHLAHIVARVHGGQNHLATPRIADDDTGFAGEQDDQGMRGLALLHDDLATFESALDHGV